MSAFGCKADMTLCGNPLSRSLLGVKRTWRLHCEMCAYDPKRASFEARSLEVRLLPQCLSPRTTFSFRRVIASLYSTSSRSSSGPPAHEDHERTKGVC